MFFHAAVLCLFKTLPTHGALYWIFPMSGTVQTLAAFILLLECLIEPAFCQVQDAAPAKDRVQTEAYIETDLNTLARQLKQVVEADPEMEGAWLDIERAIQPAVENDAARFVFRRVFDHRKSVTQSAAMDRIIQALLPAGRFSIDTANDRRFPYSELTDAIRSLLEQDVRFPGCKVLGGTYRLNPDSGAIDLVPRFQVARNGQFDALVEECRRIMQRTPAWGTIAVFDGNKHGEQMVIVPEAPEPDLNNLFTRIREAIRTQPDLQGAWLDVEADDQGYPDVAPKLYRFKRGFDSQRGAVQAASMDTFIRRLVPSGRYRIDTSKDVRLPLTQLLSALQHTIDIDPQFAGCTLSLGMYAYNDEDSSFDLVLQGRIWKAEQSELIADLCRRLMNKDAVWELADIQLQDAGRDELVISPASPAQAANYYSEAMHHFWKMDYRLADRMLALASLEDPTNVVYRYWRVIGDLAEGNQGLAEIRLKKTIDGFNIHQNSRQHVEVLRAIYRIQGPLRHALLAAERKAMVSRTTGIASPVAINTMRSVVAFD